MNSCEHSSGWES